jgi:hypothetical protein
VISFELLLQQHACASGVVVARGTGRLQTRRVSPTRWKGVRYEGATVARGNDVGDRVEGPEKARVGSPPAGRPRKTDASSVPAVNACKLS